HATPPRVGALGMKRVALPFLSIASGVALFAGMLNATTSNGPSIARLGLASLPPLRAPIPAAATPLVVATPKHTDISTGNVEGALAVATSPPTMPTVTIVATRRDDREKARRTIRNGAAGTYIGEILQERDSSIARWADRRGVPLTV